MEIIISILIGVITLLFFMKSSQTSPIIAANKDSAIFRIPDKDVKKNFLWLTIQLKVNVMEIKLIGGDGSNKSLYVHRDFPTDLTTIKSDVTYSYRFRSKENLMFRWSSWSEVKPLKRQDLPYDIPSEISSEPCETIRKSIREAKPCKILLLGKIGQGKSSFLNSVFTAYNNNYTVMATTRPDDKSVTPEKTDYDIITDKIKICDMSGWERGYNFPLLTKIIRGECDKVTIANMKNEEDQYQRVTPENCSKINVAIIVIGADDSEETSEVDQELIKKVKAANLPFITVLTKVDKLAKPNEREITKQNFYRDPRVTTRCCELQAVLHSEHVLPIINYRHDKGKDDHYIGYFALRILDLALKEAK